MRENFVSRCVKGEANVENIGDEVAAWHDSDERTYETLAQWLGLTEKEYAHFVTDATIIEKVVDQRKLTNDFRRRTIFDTPINPKMGEGRYQDTLRRFRARIAGGLDLDLDDSNFTGDKYTSGSWGLCSCQDIKAYPDVNDHAFPDRIVEDMKSGHGILPSPRGPPQGATCPFDRGRFKPDKLNPGSQGCFYRCMLFRPVKGTLPSGEREPRLPTREEALKLYDDLIAEREQKFGRKVTEDDGEMYWKPSGPLKGKKAER